MSKFSKMMKRAKKQGQSLVEYGLILALVSVVSIAVLNIMGGQIKQTVKNLNTQLQQANQLSAQSSGS